MRSLVLLMTRGMSLAAWDALGMFEREVAVYRRLRPSLDRLAIVSFGDRSEQAFSARLPGIDILCNDRDLSPTTTPHASRICTRPVLTGADVIKTNQMQGVEIAVAVKRRFGTRLVARCGYLWSEFAEREHGRSSRQAVAARAAEQLAAAEADVLVVTTEAMRRRLVLTSGADAGRVRVVPNYVDTSVFRPRSDVAVDPQRVAFVGRDSPQKNLRSLAAALEGSGLTLAIAGGAATSAAVRGWMDAHRVRAEFVGSVPNRELAVQFARSAMYLQPSLWEGHPKALIEAMACGRPVIGGDAPGIREVIEHEVTGLLCATTPAAIRDAVSRLRHDPALAARLGAGARRYVEQFLALDRVIEAESDALEMAAGSRQAGGRPAVPEDLTAEAAAGIVSGQVAGRSPADALRYLLEVEARLYPMLGRLAIAYDGGTHTKHRHTRYHDFFVHRIAAGARVLDVGCGSGEVAHDVAVKTGARVTGIDIDPAKVAAAAASHAHPSVSYLVADARAGVPGGPWDVVILSNVLEHIEDRPAFLAALDAACPGARFLVRVPLFERDWRVPLKRELGVEWRLDETHFTEYTAESFDAEVRGAGLAPVHVEYPME